MRRVGYPPMKSAWVACALFGSLAATNCAVANPMRELNPQQTALVTSTCRNIMRVLPNGVDMDACASSLAGSLMSRVQNDLGWQADRDCQSRGLPRGSAQFATCVLDEQRRGAARTMQGGPPASSPVLTYNPANDIEARQGYYDASFDTKRRREEYSCAQLGLDPNTAAFGQCVADLDASLFNADNPIR